MIKSLIASVIMSMVIWKINPVKTSAIIFTIIIGIITYVSSLLLLKGFKKEEFEFFKELFQKSSCE